jgi:hypothetical protein
MASEKQIAANRANAKRSTGPRSAVGKSKSSRNARRHGLSCPLRLDCATSERIEALTRLLVGEGRSEQLGAAAEIAEAQLELLRVRAVRREMHGEIDPNRCNIQQLRRLAAIDRYERLAHTRRRLASCKFKVLEEEERKQS